ncbi:MAG: hypothetical protein II151_06245, partial [Bacteroidales bacterium]|nr:hypothetical protein [Bacteroidales bacterium]
IVTYNPDMEVLRRNISAFIDGVGKLLVWRNSPLDEAAVTAGNPQWASKIEFCGTGENSGLPKAYNYAWKTAAAEGFTHLLTMDQDSCFTDFPAYFALAEKVPDCICGPTINDRTLPSEIIEDYTLINSGLLIPLTAAEKIGGWREDFFLDGVDMEFLFHAKAIGVKSCHLNAGHLVHALGKKATKKFLGKSYTIFDYPPKRLYEIYRNPIIVRRTYPSCTQELRRFLRKDNRERIVRILLGEKDKCEKMRAICKGIRDGLRYKI